MEKPQFQRMGIGRLSKEFAKCLDAFEGRCTIKIKNDNLYKWFIAVQPFDKKRYGSQSFELFIEFGSDYPLSAPMVKFTTSIFHPNIDTNGKMCLAALANWTTASTMNSLLEAFFQVLREPHLDDPVNVSASKLWKTPDVFFARAKK